MRIKSKKNATTHQISAEGWATLKKLGFDRLYTIVSTAKVSKPDDLNQLEVNFVKHLGKADKLFAEKKYKQAKAEYIKAGELKSTPHVSTRLAEVEDLITN